MRRLSFLIVIAATGYVLLKQWNTASFWFNLGSMLAVMLLCSFFYFIHGVAKNGVGAVPLIATAVAGVYFIGWNALIAVACGMYLGGQLVLMKFKDDLAGSDSSSAS